MKGRGAPLNLAGGDSLLSSRISGIKTRKRPKYLSIRSQLSPQNRAALTDKDVPRTNVRRLRPLRHYYTRRNRRQGDQQHLKQMQPRLPRPLLPLDNCQAMDDQVALLFTSSNNGSATLNGILDCREDDTCTTAPTVAGTSGEESVSLRCTYGRSGTKLRSAMKSSYSCRDGGENHEEKWVRFSEVVEKKEEEVSSNYHTSAAAPGGLLSLSLKLDYQEILDTWSDRSSLFICHGIGMDDSPQTVPDLCPEFDVFGRGITEWLGSGANLWKVPEKGEIGDGFNCADKEGRMRQREASVLRYKEKRHNRLFAKRIRYEVRKLNAEKRPRVKGRFVRRNGGD